MHERLSGLQFANGKQDAGFTNGRAEWIKLLLAGKKAFTVAGNDAHGNFNRFRQVQIPHVRLRESNDQLFGKMRTGIFVQTLDEHSALTAFASGAMQISDGPALNIREQRDTQATSIGKTVEIADATFVIQARSTAEFGSLKRLTVFQGSIGMKSESVLAAITSFSDRLTADLTLKFSVEQRGYIRVEVQTTNDAADGLSHFCFTNPVWLLGK